ncbi:transcriptional regulator, GntR family, partial [Listeria seeligeri FSL S4-171]
REWTNKKSSQIYELLVKEDTEEARKTIKSMFAELTIQAYR